MYKIKFGPHRELTVFHLETTIDQCRTLNGSLSIVKLVPNSSLNSLCGQNAELFVIKICGTYVIPEL